MKPNSLELLHQHRIITLATNRPDGWPQATTVGWGPTAAWMHYSVENLGTPRQPDFLGANGPAAPLDDDGTEAGVSVGSAMQCQ